MSEFLLYGTLRKGSSWAYEIRNGDFGLAAEAGGFETEVQAREALKRRIIEYCAERRAVNPVTNPNAFLRQVFQVKEG